MFGRKWFFILSFLVLIAITGFSMMRYYSLADQNRLLQKLVTGYDKKVSELKEAKIKSEKQLAQEKSELNEQLVDLQGQLEQLNKELAHADKRAASLEDANAELLASRKALEVRVSLVAKENEALEAKFESLDELKKAISDLKNKMSLEKETMRKLLREKQLLEGNRGYLTYQGFPTSRGKIKIEVIPVP